MVHVHFHFVAADLLVVLDYHCATSWIYDSVYSAYMLNIHMNIHMLHAKNTHWYILRIEPESHVVYFAYTRYYHVRLLWVC